MKTIKMLCLFSGLVLITACNSDDDATTVVPTNQELLISGKWYQESSTESTYTDCEKNSSFNFLDTTNLSVEPFDDSSGTCQSLGATEATYSLTNDVNLVLTIPGTTVNATIQSITASELVLLSNGGTIVLDKTAG